MALKERHVVLRGTIPTTSFTYETDYVHFTLLMISKRPHVLLCVWFSDKAGMVGEGALQYTSILGTSTEK